MQVYAGWWEALNDVTLLDKLCFGLPVWKMMQRCLVVASEEMSGTGQEKWRLRSLVGELYKL